MIKQNSESHVNNLLQISNSSLMSAMTLLQDSSLTSALTSDSSSTFTEISLTLFKSSSSILWQISDLILMLVNKLATALLRVSKQLCCVKSSNLKAKCLIWVLSLQVITWSKIRLIADDLVLYRKTFNNFSQKIVFSSIFISESTSYNSLNFSKKNTTILNLIKNQIDCRWSCVIQKDF